MIRSFKHKGLQLLWETGKAGKLPADQINRIQQMLEVIDSAILISQDFEFYRSWRIHPLKGNSRGYWSLTVKKNWRITFRFDGQNAFDLNYIDYH